jgi:hypothetical protein
VNPLCNGRVRVLVSGYEFVLLSIRHLDDSLCGSLSLKRYLYNRCTWRRCAYFQPIPIHCHCAEHMRRYPNRTSLTTATKSTNLASSRLPAPNTMWTTSSTPTYGMRVGRRIHSKAGWLATACVMLNQRGADISERCSEYANTQQYS